MTMKITPAISRNPRSLMKLAMTDLARTPIAEVAISARDAPTKMSHLFASLSVANKQGSPLSFIAELRDNDSTKDKTQHLPVHS